MARQLALQAACLLLLTISGASAAGGGRRRLHQFDSKFNGKPSGGSDRAYKEYELVVENLSLAQPLSPVVVATHQPGLFLYQFNSPASPEIVSVAEDGNGHPLAAKLSKDSRAKFVDILEPVPPMSTIKATIRVYEGAEYISLASMAVNTNDCFVAINGERLSLSQQSSPSPAKQVFTLPGLDAGSEANNELCSSIPGPACPPGLNVRSLNGEGFVHVHRGFHGVNEGKLGTLFNSLRQEDLSVRGTPLEAVRYDWRNPLAKITVLEK